MDEGDVDLSVEGSHEHVVLELDEESRVFHDVLSGNLQLTCFQRELKQIRD